MQNNSSRTVHVKQNIYTRWSDHEGEMPEK